MYVTMSIVTPRTIRSASQLPLRPPGCQAITYARVVHGRKTSPSSGQIAESNAAPTLSPKIHHTARTNRGPRMAKPPTKQHMEAQSLAPPVPLQPATVATRRQNEEGPPERAFQSS